MSEHDKRHMKRALSLARKGIGELIDMQKTAVG